MAHLQNLDITTSNGFIDSLALSNLLKSAKAEDEKAEIIATSMRYLQDLVSQKNKEEKKENIAQIEKENNEIKLEIIRTRKELELKLGNIDKEISIIKKDIVDIRRDIVDIRKDTVDIKKDIVGLRKDIVDIRKDITEVRISVLDTKSSLIKWIASIMLGQVAVLTAIMFTLLKVVS
jgi:chromosome segregation ATPase